MGGNKDRKGAERSERRVCEVVSAMMINVKAMNFFVMRYDSIMGENDRCRCEQWWSLGVGVGISQR